MRWGTAKSDWMGNWSSPTDHTMPPHLTFIRRKHVFHGYPSRMLVGR